MAKTQVLIVGAGQAGLQTAASLREAGYDGGVTLVGEEPGLPYQRPPLSKQFLAGGLSRDDLWFRPPSFFGDNEVELLDGERILAIDLGHKVARLASGRSLEWDHLVLATGARARHLDLPGSDLDGVLTLRTVADAEAVAERLLDARSVLVVGAGFIGLEIAAVAAGRGLPATVLETLPRPMSRATSEPLAAFYASEHDRWGTQMIFGEQLSRFLGTQGRVDGVETSGGRRIEADLVLVGVGVDPATELAAGAGLAVDGGIVVDESLRTADPSVFAIGDCARYPSPFSSGLVRLESVQNAADQARFVAAQITGADPAAYEAVPWFWSDQGDLKLQMVGLSGGHTEAVVRGDPDQRSFSVFCFSDERLLGCESVNAVGDHMAMRMLLGAGGAALPDPDQVRDPDFDLIGFAKGQRAPA